LLPARFLLVNLRAISGPYAPAMDEHPDPRWLAETPLFEGVSEDRLSELAHWFEVREYDEGHLPLAQDQHGYVFFILEEGQAHAEIEGQVMEILKPGSVFGEIAFFNPDGLRTATIVADTRIRVWSMFGTSFREMQIELPEVAGRLEALAKERSERPVAG
jgi:CRP-like cAMP-binding protein